MKLGRQMLISSMDFSNPSNTVETISTLTMAVTIITLAYKTVMNFMYYDYVWFLIMGVWYYKVREKYHVVPPHQVPTKKPIKNGKKDQLNENNSVLVNSVVQKEKQSSITTEPVQWENPPKKLKEENTQPNGSENVLEYHELCKYFEEKDFATSERKAKLASKLIECGFTQDKAIDAATNCHDFESAFIYLTQICDSCKNDFSIPEVISMIMCTHKFCKSCAKTHYSKAIKERNILKCTCQICEMPKLENEEEARIHFKNIYIDLESLLPSELCKIFKQELESGKWKVKLKSKQLNQQRNIGKSQTNPVKTSSNSSVPNTGVMTRSAARALRNIYDRNDQISEPTSSTRLYSSHFSTTKVPVIPMETTGTTAGSSNNLPETGIESLSRIKDSYNSLQDECSFCTVICRKTYKMISCEHKLCYSCANYNFSETIHNKDVINCVCPLCLKPQLQEVSKEEFFKYFQSFRESFRFTLNVEMLQLFEEKFKAYVENVFGEDYYSTKNYTTTQLNDQGNYNQMQSSCDHQVTPDSQVPLCDHPRCVECVKEAITKGNILDLVCDTCYKGHRDAKIEFLYIDKTINMILRDAVGPAFYKIFSTCLNEACAHKTSRFSSMKSGTNSVREYVEESWTRCPRCTNFCELTRDVDKLITCLYCKTEFCGICKVGSCERGCIFPLGLHAHHKNICKLIVKKKGYDKLEGILKSHRVHFVSTESRSYLCLFRESCGCKSESFKSDLCRNHYSDYLAHLIIKHRIEC